MIKHRHFQGVTLIELLVTMVIVSVGVLGVAGLQIVSLQQAREAGQRMIALQAANDLLDRIRVNKNQSYAWARSTAISAASATNCAAASCTAASLKDYDLQHWACRLGQPSNDCETVFGLVDADFDRLSLAAGEVIRTAANSTYSLGSPSAGTASIATVNYEISVYWSADAIETSCGARDESNLCQKISITAQVN